ncbi:MAG: PQQ-binding-like beta-propeller repeat protein [bacterium]|nr:PQQ-binding-like beta-propeller repeat protein [bacterium]
MGNPQKSPDAEHPWGGRPGGAEEVGGSPEGGTPQEEQVTIPGGETPGEQGSPSGVAGFNFPKTDENALLPSLPSGTPQGAWVTQNLGNVEIKYFSTAIAWDMSESGVDSFITLKNKGTGLAVVNFTPVENLLSQVPSWNLHFFDFQGSSVTLSPGEEEKLWYFASVDQAGTFTVKFKMWLGSDSGSYVEAPIVFGAVQNSQSSLYGKETSFIYGYVKDENGQPLSGVKVSAQMNCGRLGNQETSDSQGRYMINVWAQEDVNAIYQGKELACSATDYFLSAEKSGYEYYFKEHVNPTRKVFAKADIVLEKKIESASYSQKWAKQVSEPYGFFWVKPSADWSVFAASQAKHEPQLNKATNFYLFDSSGNIVWQQPTGNECWGIDIASDGSYVVAACHDQKVYAVSRAGSLLWTADLESMVRSACISNDGNTVLSGTLDAVSLFNSATGAKTDYPWGGGWFRNCAFYLDDSGFIAGGPGVSGFTSSGVEKWQQEIGEFPMFLGVDQSKNVFAAGKSRTLFSFDSSGNLRWKERIPDHVAGAGAVTPDGKKIALGTVGGMVYLFDGSGSLLWKRHLSGSGEPADFIGHNAVAISDDGQRIVVGTAPGNCVIVFNGSGTVLWKKCIDYGTIESDLIPGVTNVQISPDKTKIIASYGDNYIREFIIQ